MRNIILIGMSGVGKSTIGKALSEAIRMEFVDTDFLIEKRLSMSIDEIFNRYGEDYFRKIESNIIKELCKYDNLVISTGGGVILDNNNIILMKKKGILILLDSSLENIVTNINKSNTVRPLLKEAENLYNKVKSIYSMRKNIYESSADFIINVNNKTVDEIVYEIQEFCAKINY